MSRLLNLNYDTLGIIYDFLLDDFNFLYFLKINNLRPKNKDIIWENLNWNTINSKDLPNDFIREFHNYLNWNILTSENLDNEEFIREFPDNIVWDLISSKMIFNEKYSYKFFEDFKEKLDWDKITQWRNMAEDFIIKFEEDLNWNTLSKCQGLTEYLIHRFHHKINWDRFSNNYNIERSFRNEILDLYDNDEEQNDEEKNNNELEHNDFFAENEDDDIVNEYYGPLPSLLPLPNVDTDNEENINNLEERNHHIIIIHDNTYDEDEDEDEDEDIDITDIKDID